MPDFPDCACGHSHALHDPSEGHCMRNDYHHIGNGLWESPCHCLLYHPRPTGKKGKAYLQKLFHFLKNA